VSRRALFTLPPILNQPVVGIRADRCACEAGCQLCVEVCPRDALTKLDGRILVDKSRCEACGLCVAECPRAAAELPTASLPQIEAELSALLRTPALAASEPRACLFVCRRNAAALEDLARKGGAYPLGWLPVEIPCGGMVTPSWLLGCLAMGADAVGVLACAGDCSFSQHERLEGTMAYCRDVLTLLGRSPEAVRLLQPSPEAELAEALAKPLRPDGERVASERQDLPLSEPGAAARAILTLARHLDVSTIAPFAHSSSPLGLARIDSGKCTACAGCARACPTGALVFREDDGALSLDFDAALCTSCEQCLGWCPEAAEQAIRIEQVTDLSALAQGRVTLLEDTEVKCERCGGVIGPTAMLRRVEHLLTRSGDANEATIASIARRCPSCRVAGVSGGVPVGRRRKHTD